MEALVAANPEYDLVRRVNTRRAGEIGEDSVPVDETTFDDMVRQGDFLLHWRAHDLRYAIPARVQTDLAAGRTLLVNLSRSVLLQAQTRVDQLIVFSLTAPPEILADRLIRRGREDADDIEQRLARAARALPHGLRHVFEVSNAGALSNTVAEILELLHPESAVR